MQTIDEFQKMCANVVKEIDAKYNIKRDPQLGFAQFMEEVGELVTEINRPKIRNQEIDREKLNSGFADVMILFLSLAEVLHVNVGDAVEAKIKILKETHQL